jgi:hypothetical protein
MRFSITFVAGLILLSAVALPDSVSAYNGYVNSAINGEHPYEQRYQEMRIRKKLQEERSMNGYDWLNDEIYQHPSFAKVSTLHPFYRKGGQSFGGSYAEWRGYMDPVLFQELSPDTYCMNFRFQRLQNHSMPFGHECY